VLRYDHKIRLAHHASREQVTLPSGDDRDGQARVNMVQGVNIENGCIVDVNPATGAVIDRVPVSSRADVDAAVRAANLAQPAWAALSVTERTVAVKAAVRRIGAIKVTLAPLITAEMGKTLREAESEVDDNSDMDAYCDLVAAANAPEFHGSSVIVRHAHGVVSICAPWNYPVEEIVMLSIPALVAGNAIVIKPSEVVPHASGAVVKCLMDGLNGAYPGLVGLLQGDGGVGGYLVAHPDVHMCAFTGSTATGANILESASKTLKRVVLECGGKDPMVVMGDADLDQAARDAVTFSLQNCGQVCCAVERVYVAEAVANEFELKVLQHASKWKAGDGMDDSSTIGPCVSEMQRQTVHAHVQAAIESGARCLLGGKMPPASDKGTFYPPTVLANVPHVSQITQEETFGPVLAISTFAGDDGLTLNPNPNPHRHLPVQRLHLHLQSLPIGGRRGELLPSTGDLIPSLIERIPSRVSLRQGFLTRGPSRPKLRPSLVTLRPSLSKLRPKRANLHSNLAKLRLSIDRGPNLFMGCAVYLRKGEHQLRRTRHANADADAVSSETALSSVVQSVDSAGSGGKLVQIRGLVDGYTCRRAGRGKGRWRHPLGGCTHRAPPPGPRPQLGAGHCPHRASSLGAVHSRQVVTRRFFLVLTVPILEFTQRGFYCKNSTVRVTNTAGCSRISTGRQVQPKTHSSDRGQRAVGPTAHTGIFYN